MLNTQLTKTSRPLVYPCYRGNFLARNLFANSLLKKGKNSPMRRTQAGHAPDNIDASERRWVRRRVLKWFDEHGRDFSWRERRNPYRVLVAELLLQRTRADLVAPLYEDFMARYPDAAALASASTDDVVAFLRPLGFAHRSARLPRLARDLCDRHGGDVPNSKEALLALPGVGEYVANAVLSVAFGERRPLLDPNVIRLVGRVFGATSELARAREDRRLWEQIAALLPRKRAADFALALVDLGATICRTRRPRCHECPLRARCVAYTAGAVDPADPPISAI